ncbi:MAG TPA: hypothetical protein VHT26_07705 [Trebonia sp.]|nr:hypothetical protein [Trebonia sp.]
MFPDGDRNSPPAAVCMGTSAAPPAAEGAAAAGAALAGVAVTAGALTADDVPGLQADSASPTPRPTAEMPAILVTRVKCRKFTVISPCRPAGSGVTVDDGQGHLVVVSPVKSAC